MTLTCLQIYILGFNQKEKIEFASIRGHIKWFINNGGKMMELHNQNTNRWDYGYSFRLSFPSLCD